MAELTPIALRVLASELRHECARLEQTAAELAGLGLVAADDATSHYLRYASAALLQSFYTGLEKALSRVARQFGGVPDGALPNSA